MVAVVELQDLVGDPDVDVATGRGLAEADLLQFTQTAPTALARRATQ